MESNLSTLLNYFTFGMLLTLQAFGTTVMYFKGKEHRLQRTMFWFMAYLMFISAFELFYFMCLNHSPISSHLTDILEMSVVPWALAVLSCLLASSIPIVWIGLPGLLIYGGSFIAYAFTFNETVYLVLFLFTIVLAVGIIGYGIIGVRNFNHVMEQYFSNDSFSVSWLRSIVWLYVLLISVWTVATLMEDELVITIYNVVCLVILGLLCYFVYRQEDMLEMLKTLKNKEEKQERKTKNTTVLNFENELTEAFANKQVFLNPKLNISDLALVIGTNRSYLSAYFNQNLNTTFYDYVNSWRIQYSEQLLCETSENIETVSEQSGFNSLSSFRRYFIKAKGMTPTEYRQQKRS